MSETAPTTTAQASGSGSREEEVEEDAAELKFPAEFEKGEALLSSEVYLLLEHRRAQSEQSDELAEMSPVFLKTLAYTQRLARFKNRETIRALRQLLGSAALHKFELAQLGNLCQRPPRRPRLSFPPSRTKSTTPSWKRSFATCTARRHSNSLRLTSLSFFLLFLPSKAFTPTTCAV